MIIKTFRKHTDYLYYFSSIVLGRGLEYLWFFIISYYATKKQYGEFELYKKIIEFFAVFVSLGFPALIITYARSKEQKADFFVTGFLLSVLLTLAAALLSFLLGKNYFFLIVPVLFFTIFHYSNSIYQAYNLVERGSKYASLYKGIVSIFFTASVLIFFFIIEDKELALIYCTYPLLLIGTIYFIKNFSFQRVINSYNNIAHTLKTQLYNGSVLFLSTLVNTSLLAIDIFIISYYSGNVDGKLADYSFPLMIANILLIIPLTLTNVDVEKYKMKHLFFTESLKKNNYFTLACAVFVFVFYWVLVKYFYIDYENTIWLFSIILVGKVIQSITIPFGVYLATKGIYTYILKVLLFSLAVNIIASFFLYEKFGLIGIAFISLLCLLIRFLFYVKRYYNGRNLWNLD